MKPIGLVTCYFHHNYGSMLQAYATEMIFQKMNLPYQTISCKSPIVYMQGNKLLYIWGIERSGFFNGREKWAKGFENQRV